MDTERKLRIYKLEVCVHCGNEYDEAGACCECEPKDSKYLELAEYDKCYKQALEDAGEMIFSMQEEREPAVRVSSVGKALMLLLQKIQRPND